ncbi:hypothetical protein [Halomonas smyrnensis]|uniref:hypothetical protein n=1 Tax=Halomonas smyrnensis TaxID=720605 RepID=UPI00030DBED9|nr:hypothetical protein [Halomonas smyrnensis]
MIDRETRRGRRPGGRLFVCLSSALPDLSIRDDCGRTLPPPEGTLLAASVGR